MSNQYNSIAELFTSCPFDNTYAHTLEPMSIASKLSWLESNAGYNASQDRFTQLMLVKLDTATDRGTLKLTCLDSKAFSYNYAYIHNKNGSYFCFITGCRYINDATQGNTSTSVYEFDLEIDIMMTYLISSSQLKPCMVARQHSGLNYVPEPVIVKEYKKYKWTNLTASYNFNADNSVAVFGVVDEEGSGLLDNCFTGMYFAGFSMEKINGLRPGVGKAINWLHSHASDEDVKFGYMLPKSLLEHYYNLHENVQHGLPVLKITNKENVSPIVINMDPPSETLDYYKPKNSKLLYYPFKYRVVTDGNGSEIILKNELWNYINKQQLLLYFNASPTPSIRVVPWAYDCARGRNGDMPIIYADEDKNTTLTISNFPMIAWSYSAFEQWLGRSLVGSTLKHFGNYLPLNIST